MRTAEIETQQGTYPIHIGENILDQVPQYATGKTMIVTDSHVSQLHLHRLAQHISEHQVIVVPAGEQSKSAEQLFSLYDQFAAFGLSRNDTVIGFGGGVIGDLTGYAAGSYMRGVNYIAVPTTLLAMVDSSVGGKVAINHRAGKNLIGMFYQPRAVIADTSLLLTLDSRQVACGMAEVIKYACIDDENLFQQLMQNNPSIDALVERCVQIKDHFVRQDTFDRGLRMMLNFGHTIGHGVENGCGYGTVLHGEAVAIGMVKESEIGEKLGITEPGTAEKIRNLCNTHHLPTELPAISNLLDIIAHDKKSETDGVKLALLRRIGQGELHHMSLQQLEELL